MLKRHWNWLRWVIALAVLGWLFYNHREDVTALANRSLNGGAATLAVLLVTSGILTTFVRWYLLTSAQNLSLTLREAVRLGFLGYLFNNVAPGSVGGDLVKMGMLVRAEPDRKTIAISTIVLDRILGMIALFWVGTSAMFLIETPINTATEFTPIRFSFVMCSAGGLAGLLLMLWPGLTTIKPLQWCEGLPFVGRLFREVHQSIRLYQESRDALLKAIGMSIVGHLLMLSGFYWCARTVADPSAIPGYIAHFQLMAPAQLMGILVPLPGGIGALEGAVQWFYTVGGFDGGNGFLGILAFRGVTVMLTAVGAAYYFASRQEIDSAIEAVEDEPLHVTPEGAAPP